MASSSAALAANELSAEAAVMVNVGGMQNMAWAADTSKFGYKMLLKMGWSAGKGVGKDLQGDAAHVKIARRSENLGLGCSLKQAEVQGWSNTAQGFADVLKTLNKSYGDESNSDEDSDDEEAKKRKKKLRKEKKKKEKKDKKKKEKKESKKASSSAVANPRRILYHKRLRNKNAQGYDAADMSAILGQAASSS